MLAGSVRGRDPVKEDRTSKERNNGRLESEIFQGLLLEALVENIPCQVTIEEQMKSYV